MSIMKIFTFPEPVLREKALPVTEFDAELKRLIKDMFETMYDAPGVGLAANQVGVLKQLFVLDVEYRVEGDEESNRKLQNQSPLVFINPEIVETSKKIPFKEGCLSVPGFSEEVERFEKLSLKYQDESGKHLEIKAEGLLAVAIQHEMDHLAGRLFIDRLSPAKRQLIKGKIKKDHGRSFERSKFHVEL